MRALSPGYLDGMWPNGLGDASYSDIPYFHKSTRVAGVNRIEQSAVWEVLSKNLGF